MKHTTIYTMIKIWNEKNMKECDKQKPYKQETSYDLYIF
jgi:hypothetical protein